MLLKAQAFLLMMILVTAVVLAPLKSSAKDGVAAQSGGSTGSDIQAYAVSAVPPAVVLIPVVHMVEVEKADDGWHVGWQAGLPADYNQDGVVNIADLTPLAVHFGETVSEHPAAVVVDGNQDGVVNIADITPLAMDFGTELTGFEIQLAGDEEGPYTTAMTVGFNEHQPPAQGRLSYETIVITDVVTGYLLVKPIIIWGMRSSMWMPWNKPIPLPTSG